MEPRGTGSAVTRWSSFVILALFAFPALSLRAGMWHASVPVETLCYGVAVVAAAFLLTWAAEAAEHDISQALALAVLALIAVLPEYAVDLSFAWKAGDDPKFAAYAAANMTGGNRLLVGFGWSAVVFIFFLRTRRNILTIAKTHRLELIFLAIATIYSFTMPLKGSINLIDSVLLIALFIAYVFFAARNPSEEPDLMGPAKVIGNLPTAKRRFALVTLFVWSAVVILASAEPFAEGLVHTGTEFGIDEFLLVQWVAPLASESPEFIAAGMMAWNMRAGAGMGALISSKVNQWTLLIGGLPIAYALSNGSLDGLPLDERQVEEIFLTAAQSLFAVGVLVSMSISLLEAGLLAGLFVIQAAVPNTTFRVAFAVLYVVLAVFIFIKQRAALIATYDWLRGREEPEPLEAGSGGQRH